MLIRDRLEFSEAEMTELCQHHHVRELALFGSVLRDDFREGSDIDMLVEFEPGASIGLFEFAGLQQDLSELLGRKVDLVSKAGLHQMTHEQVLNAAQIIYAAGSGVRIPSMLDSEPARAVVPFDRDVPILHNAVESCAAIQEFAAEADAATAEADDLRRSAILFELSRLGEAIKLLSPALRQRHADTTWQAVIGAGADAVEKYWDIDWERM